ncbi:MAG: phosphatidic acid phosphatase [Ruminococcaceae bacterium]|nr:phosphatidic acid phosphatase [Oscillospiraceae bacterium]
MKKKISQFLINNEVSSKRALIEAAFGLIFIFSWNMCAYRLPKIIAADWYHYDMTLPVDDLVPFAPWTITIYFGCYIFWGVNYILAVLQKKEERDRFILAELIAKGICFALFLLIPTTNVRPDVSEPGFWNWWMTFLYNVDSPDNLFPSVHCLVSWFCWIGVRKRKDIPFWYRAFSLVFTLAIFVSTLTTRQHVIVDVISGALIAELCYMFTGIDKVRGLYSKLSSAVSGFVTKKLDQKREKNKQCQNSNS